MKKLFVSGIIVVLMHSSLVKAGGGPYEELAPRFSRLKSSAFVRKVKEPTLANLDYAAYDRNPLFNHQQRLSPQPPDQEIMLEQITFNGNLKAVYNSIEQTPLTQQEINSPLAWRPLIRKMWTEVKEQQFQTITGEINSYKWDDPSIFQPYQQVTTGYIHDTGNGHQIWVKIEFSPWVTFLPNVSDEDGDGVQEMYGRIDLQGFDEVLYEQAVNWILTDYSSKVLSMEEVEDWVIMLASFWYPSLNTDVLEASENKIWPNSHTPRRTRKELRGLTQNSPFAVIEGKPFSPKRPIYNVFVIDSHKNDDLSGSAEKTSVQKGMMDLSVSDNFKKNNKTLSLEIEKYGSYAAWKGKNAPFFETVRNYLHSYPPEQMAIRGEGEWLFFRNSFNYLLGGDLNKQSFDKNPLPHILSFKEHMDKHNVNFLFVAVPNKEEIYFDKLSDSITQPAVPIVNPYGRKFFADLQEAGVEVIDLLPAFLEAKDDDANHTEPLYQYHDTHWTKRGIQVAARIISNRIMEYSWYDKLDKRAYTINDTDFYRMGDIVDRLPESEQYDYSPTKLQAKRVYDNTGNPYRGNANDPILLMGDSFTGVFESVDCRSAGIGAHIAAQSSVPVDIITSWGGGPLVRHRAMRARGKDLDAKRLVIYMMTARDLYDYSQNWEPFP